MLLPYAYSHNDYTDTYLNCQYSMYLTVAVLEPDSYYLHRRLHLGFVMISVGKYEWQLAKMKVIVFLRFVCLWNCGGKAQAIRYVISLFVKIGYAVMHVGCCILTQVLSYFRMGLSIILVYGICHSFSHSSYFRVTHKLNI